MSYFLYIHNIPFPQYFGGDDTFVPIKYKKSHFGVIDLKFRLSLI